MKSQSFIHQVRILSWGILTPRGRPPRVAILYSSSQNSLQHQAGTVLLWVQEGSRNPLFIKSEFSLGSPSSVSLHGIPASQSFIHQVRILSSRCIFTATPQTMRGSQSFIHQVRILSRIAGRGRWAQPQSQSFIHQVRILSQDSACPARQGKETSRNPLFIKSEFSPARACAQAIVCLARNGRRNPLFIKSEFSQHLRNPLPCMG